MAFDHFLVTHREQSSPGINILDTLIPTSLEWRNHDSPVIRIRGDAQGTDDICMQYNSIANGSEYILSEKEVVAGRSISLRDVLLGGCCDERRTMWKI